MVEDLAKQTSLASVVDSIGSLGDKFSEIVPKIVMDDTIMGE